MQKKRDRKVVRTIKKAAKTAKTYVAKRAPYIFEGIGVSLIGGVILSWTHSLPPIPI